MIKQQQNKQDCILHSSRMHTDRLLTVSPSMHCAGGGGVCPGGVCRGGCLPRGWVSAPSCICCYLYAASTPTECQHQCSCLCSMTQVHAGIHTPPPVNRMTDRCKNITLSQISFAGGKKCCQQVPTFIHLDLFCSHFVVIIHTSMQLLEVFFLSFTPLYFAENKGLNF